MIATNRGSERPPHVQDEQINAFQPQRPRVVHIPPTNRIVSSQPSTTVQVSDASESSDDDEVHKGNNSTALVHNVEQEPTPGITDDNRIRPIPGRQTLTRPRVGHWNNTVSGYWYDLPIMGKTSINPLIVGGQNNGEEDRGWLDDILTQNRGKINKAISSTRLEPHRTPKNNTCRFSLIPRDFQRELPLRQLWSSQERQEIAHNTRNNEYLTINAPDTRDNQYLPSGTDAPAVTMVSELLIRRSAQAATIPQDNHRPREETLHDRFDRFNVNEAGRTYPPYNRPRTIRPDDQVPRMHDHQNDRPFNRRPWSSMPTYTRERSVQNSPRVQRYRDEPSDYHDDGSDPFYESPHVTRPSNRTRYPQYRNDMDNYVPRYDYGDPLPPPRRSARDQSFITTNLVKMLDTKKIMFSGARDDDLGEYLDRVDEIKTLVGAEDCDILKVLIVSLEGTARKWYRSHSGQWRTWAEAKTALKEKFNGMPYQHILHQDIESRLQRENESLREYLATMRSMMERTEPRWEVSRQIHTALRNMSPQAGGNLAIHHYDSFDALEKAAEMLEAIKRRPSFRRPVTGYENQRERRGVTDNRYRSNYPPRYPRVNVIQSEEEIDDFDCPPEELEEGSDCELHAIAPGGKSFANRRSRGDTFHTRPPTYNSSREVACTCRCRQHRKPVPENSPSAGVTKDIPLTSAPAPAVTSSGTVGANATNNDTVRRCHHCDAVGHFSRDCPHPRKLRCWSCGREGCTSVTCPDCNPPGNERRDA